MFTVFMVSIVLGLIISVIWLIIFTAGVASAPSQKERLAKAQHDREVREAQEYLTLRAAAEMKAKKAAEQG